MERDHSSAPLVALIAPANAWGNDIVPLITCLRTAGFECVEFGLGGTDPADHSAQVVEILREFDDHPPAAMLLPDSEFLDCAWLHDGLAGATGIARFREYAHAHSIPVVSIALGWKGFGTLDSLGLDEPPEYVRDRLRTAMARSPKAMLHLPDVFEGNDSLIALLWLNRKYVAVISPDQFEQLTSILKSRYETDPLIRSLARFLIGYAVEVVNDRGAVRLPNAFEIDPTDMRAIRVNRNAVLFGHVDEDRLWWPFQNDLKEDPT